MEPFFYIPFYLLWTVWKGLWIWSSSKAFG